MLRGISLTSQETTSLPHAFNLSASYHFDLILLVRYSPSSYQVIVVGLPYAMIVTPCNRPRPHSIFGLLCPKHMNIEILGTITLLVVLYGCETWSLTLRQEHTLTVLENRVLTRIFGPKGYEAM
jgi:hypothetical protein